MNVSPSKENILKKIRKALSESTPLPFPKSEGNESVYQPLQQEVEVEFGEQFTKLQGRFIFCINQQELAFQLNSLVKKQDWHGEFREHPGDSGFRRRGCPLIGAQIGSTSWLARPGH